MAEWIVIHGYVLGVWGAYSVEARRKNLRALAMLPETRRGLTRGMFGITGPGTQHGSYQADMIHLGWTMKDGFDVLPEYLAQFCELLRRMCWEEARVYVKGPYGRALALRWRATSEAVSAATKEVPEAISSWELDDGGSWPSEWLACERKKLT